jgi:hypothetical protein
MSGVYVYRQDNQPYAQIPNQAIRDPEITASAFRLLAYLMSHKDGYKLTYDQIERQTTMGRYAINEAIKLLTKKGWLRVERPKKDNGQFDAKAWYVLNPYESATVGDSTVEPPHVVPPTDIKKTNNNKKTNNKDIAFDDFWNSYPKRLNKAQAERAWLAAIKKESAEVIIERAKAYANSPNLPEMTYIPYPATWLNNERWTDEQLKEKPLPKLIIGKIPSQPDTKPKPKLIIGKIKND